MAEIPINYLKYIDQDGTEKKVYPITVTDAVYDSDGNKLSNVLLGVLKDTDISNVQSDSTTTVPSSALLKATDDKIGDTSSLPGDAGNVVSAITQLNSDISSLSGKVLWYGRVSSPDFDLQSLKQTNPELRIIFCLASTSMTEHRPYLDGYIITFVWDTGSYGVQVFVPHGTVTLKLQIRSYNSGTWSASWADL